MTTFPTPLPPPLPSTHRQTNTAPTKAKTQPQLNQRSILCSQAEGDEGLPETRSSPLDDLEHTRRNIETVLVMEGKQIYRYKNQRENAGREENAYPVPVLEGQVEEKRRAQVITG